TSKENKPLLRGFREVSDVIPLDRKALRSPLHSVAETFRLLRQLRAGKFSLVVDFQGYGETAWLSWWSGARERWGSVYGAGRQWAYTCGVTRNPRIHPADWNLSLMQQCGLRMGEIRNEFILSDDVLAEARKFFTENNLDVTKPTLFLQPFTSTPLKNWPLENYLALAHFWRKRGVQIIFSGGPGDKTRLEPARTDGFIVAAGIPDAGLMKLSTVIVGGDTGFLHLAVALQKRVIMLIMDGGAGSAVPFRHPDWAIKAPSGLTVEHIKVDDVLKACATAFQECGVA
ncbi:MAG TPA: glycosyltransferase family 9 protein, partial [Candidatus Baltobacteraceae bacterium]|nr:glycosyltransferase family 9 protein [Candidatus Baltobacteraceae bacterium]